MNGGSFHSSSFHIANWTGQVDASWSEGQADITDPALSRDFGQSDTSLMQTDIAHAAEDYEVIICIITVSADLALGILILPLFFLLLDISLHFGYLLPVFFLSVGLHILEVLLLLGMELIDEL